MQYSKEVDVWAYGCFAYELVQMKPPHHHHYEDRGLDALLDAIIKIDAPPIKGNWSPELKDFISKTIVRDPRQRWSFAQLLGHPLFEGVELCREGWVQEYANWKQNML